MSTGSSKNHDESDNAAWTRVVALLASTKCRTSTARTMTRSKSSSGIYIEAQSIVVRKTGRVADAQLIRSCALPLKPTWVPPLKPAWVPPLMPTWVPPLMPTSVPPLKPTSVPPLKPTSVPPLMPTSAPPLMPTCVPPLVARRRRAGSARERIAVDNESLIIAARSGKRIDRFGDAARSADRPSMAERFPLMNRGPEPAGRRGRPHARCEHRGKERDGGSVFFAAHPRCRARRHDPLPRASRARPPPPAPTAESRMRRTN
jgi:hypothetical protein